MKATAISECNDQNFELEDCISTDEESLSQCDQNFEIQRHLQVKKCIVSGFGSIGYDSTQAAIEYVYDQYNQSGMFDFYELVKPTEVDVKAHLSEIMKEFNRDSPQGFYDANVQYTYIHFVLGNQEQNQFLVSIFPNYPCSTGERIAIQFEDFSVISLVRSEKDRFEELKEYLHMKTADLTSGRSIFVTLPRLQDINLQILGNFLSFIFSTIILK